MSRLLKVITFLCLGLSLSHKAYSFDFSQPMPRVGNDSLFTELPDRGPTNCALLSYPGQRSRHGVACHATILSPSQIIMGDQACLNYLSPRSTKISISCNGDRTRVQLTEIPPHSRYDGAIVFNLPEPLQVPGAQLAQTRQERDDLLERGVCELTGALLEESYLMEPVGQGFRINLLPDGRSRPHITNREHYSRTLGAQLSCQDEDGVGHIVAVIGDHGNFVFLDEHPELLESLTHEVSSVEELGLLQTVEQTCSRAGECLEHVSSTSLELTEQTRQILIHLQDHYHATLTESQRRSSEADAQELFQEYLVFNEHLTEILQSCQEIRLREIHRRDGELEHGIGSGARSYFESAIVNIGSLLSDDYIFNQFKDVPILSENLSEERMREVINDVMRNNPGASRMQQITLSAQAMTNEVIGKFIDDMGLAQDDEQRAQLLEEITSDFNQCIVDATHSGQIDICANRVSSRAPAHLARLELERQLEQNFRDLFSDRDGELNQQAYDRMLADANVAFQECLLNYYYDENNQDVELIDKARACVYEAMLVGYREASRHQIDDTVRSLITDPRQREELIGRIRRESQNCAYGPLFHSAGNLSAHHYHTLARLETEEFERELLSCSETLMDITGAHTVRLTLQNDPSVRSSIPEAELPRFQELAIENYYNPCMQWQRGRPGAHPSRCEDFITHMVTLDVAQNLMDNTIAEQLVALENIDQERRDQLNRELSQQVLERTAQCQANLHEYHRRHLNELLRPDESPPHNDQLIACLNQGIGHIAESIAALQLEDTFLGDESLRQYAQELLENPAIRGLPQQVRECFTERVEALGTVEGLESALAPIIEECSLDAEKEATLIAAGFILQDQLRAVIPNAEERGQFIEEYLNGPNGLALRVREAQNKAELEQITGSIAQEVAVRFAQNSVPDLVREMLEGKVDEERQQELQAEIIDSLTDCLSRGEDVDLCVNLTTRLGNQLIASEIIALTLGEHLSSNPGRSRELAEESRGRLNQCLESVDPLLEGREFGHRTDRCVASEIFTVSEIVPRELMLNFALLMGGPSNPTAVEQSLSAVDEAINQRGALTPAMANNAVQASYGNLRLCLIQQERRLAEGPSGYENLQGTTNCQSRLRMRSGPTTEHTIVGHIPCQSSNSPTPVIILAPPQGGWVNVRYQGIQGFVSTNFLNVPPPREIQESEDGSPLIDLDQYLAASEQCTNQFEQEVTASIRRHFINTPRPGKRNEHNRALGLAIDTLLLLQGTPAPGSPNSNPSENHELMNLVADQVVSACTYNLRECERRLQNTQAQIQRFRESNPNATSEQLQSRFIRSSFIDLAIEANITQTLQRELHNALSDRFDAGGILQNRLRYITSPAMIQQILENRYGQAAKEYIRNAIENGRATGIEDDPRLRMILASAVTADLGNGSFVDELMYGLVQPELLEQRDSFRVGFGSLFGIVSRQNFDWHRVRNTPEGREAKRIFARDILEPTFQGQEINRLPSSQGGSKSLMDDHLARIEYFVEQGIRNLSR